MVDFGPVQPGDVDELVAYMRQQDINECWAAGQAPRNAVVAGVEVSAWCYTLRVDGRLACIFGVAQGAPQIGVPWLLGTPVIADQARVLIPHVMPYIQRMLADFPGRTASLN